MEKKEVTKSPISKVATYSIKLTTYEDGKTKLNRTCEGFYPIELLGLLDLSRGEIIDQMNGKIKPDIIERHVVKRIKK